MARFWCWDRSFWHETTMPLGRWVIRTAESVTLTCWPPAPLRPVGVDAEVLRVDLGLFRLVEGGNGVEGGERRLAPGLGVEGRDAHQAVDALLGRQQAVGVAALHDEGGGADPRLLGRGDLVDLDAEAPTLGPAAVHPQHHVGPVGGVGAAGAGVDLADGVALVVVAGEERLEVEAGQFAVEVRDPGLDLALQ